MLYLSLLAVEAGLLSSSYTFFEKFVLIHGHIFRQFYKLDHFVTSFISSLDHKPFQNDALLYRIELPSNTAYPLALFVRATVFLCSCIR